MEEFRIGMEPLTRKSQRATTVFATKSHSSVLPGRKAENRPCFCSIERLWVIPKNREAAGPVYAVDRILHPWDSGKLLIVLPLSSKPESERAPSTRFCA